MHYDAIVVGAGAAGGAAALELARLGIKVLVLERYPWPRYKPCAGGITRKTWNILKLDIADLLRFHAREISLSYKLDHERTRLAREVFVLMVVRTELDALVVREAVKAGAVLRDGLAVSDLSLDKQGVTLKAGTDWLRARYVIAADGANSVINSKLKLHPRTQTGFAIEANLYGAAAEAGEAGPRMTLDFGTAPKGYGWIFPKGDHLCVGLYTTEGKIAQARAALLDYIKAKGFDAGRSVELKGQQIPLDGYRYRQRELPVLLAGDAAGFADALTGEGIYYAMLSGQLAAQTVTESLAGKAEGVLIYNRLLEQKLLPELRLGSKLGRLFYGALPVTSRLLKRRRVATCVLEAAIEGTGYRDLLWHAPTYIWRALQMSSLPPKASADSY